MLINDTDALRWLVCVVISLSLPLPVQKTGLLFSLVFVLISARPKQRKFLVLLAVLGSCHSVLAAETAAGAHSTADQRHGECGFRQQLYPRKSAGPLSGDQ
ncbi:hypothetical protein HOLDEFILI_03540 [Holdemania filiformis DSM 12042]|uniref:Uncharacterized protein n=1 Tax=Holdemania filiformis DSM 12042 TaxID=545696 RepID=B9YCH9_9FIRM|nr:hypothetical protein HOLDEFILI_03540 [Holdemania filiformis DSM 12042]